jgi:hypothetical protein
MNIRALRSLNELSLTIDYGRTPKISNLEPKNEILRILQRLHIISARQTYPIPHPTETVRSSSSVVR